MRVARRGEKHDLQDLTVAVRFEGDFESAHVAGDNSAVLPTDTMKNTVYAVARESPAEDIEELALALSEHFLRGNPAVSLVEVSIEQRLWNRLDGTAFEGSRSDRRSARISRRRDGATVESGLTGLLILKSARSAFSGFRRDRYTTLAETEDRILATSLTAECTPRRRVPSPDGKPCAGRSSRRSRRATAPPCSTRSTQWDRRRSADTRSSRRSA